MYSVQLIGTRAKLIVGHIRHLGCNVEIIDSPDKISPYDICIATGVHYIIKEKYLKIPRLGIWGFHETALPAGRGCAPIQWTVLNGLKTLTVSFFELDKRVDSGRILGTKSVRLAKTMLLEDIRQETVILYHKLLDTYLIPFLRNKITPREQTGVPTYYRKRRPKDSRLDVNKPLKDLWDLIRVCDNDNFPAWFKIGQDKFILKRYHG